MGVCGGRGRGRGAAAGGDGVHTAPEDAGCRARHPDGIPRQDPQARTPQFEIPKVRPVSEASGERCAGFGAGRGLQVG